MKKIYLSRAQTRAMALDHPIGDPYGGAAYGEKDDPVSALALAGSAMSVASGISIGIGSWAGGLMVAGGVLSGLGTLTGNKKLSMLGGFASLAGGGLNVFNNWDSISSGFNQGFGEGMSKLGSAFFGGKVEAPAGTGATSVNIPEAIVEGGRVDVGGGMIPQASGGTGVFSALEPANQFSNAGGWNNLTGATPVGQNSMASTLSIGANAGNAAGAATTPTGALEGAWNWFDKQNPLVKYGLLSTASGVAQGLLSGPEEERKLEMMEQKLRNDATLTQAQAEALRLQIDTKRQQLQNMQYQMNPSQVPKVNQNYQSPIQRTGTYQFGGRAS